MKNPNIYLRRTIYKILSSGWGKVYALAHKDKYYDFVKKGTPVNEDFESQLIGTQPLLQLSPCLINIFGKTQYKRIEYIVRKARKRRELLI